MKFKSLIIENFMTFRREQKLPLADLGLVLVRGDNRLSGATDSNGVGKTAIFDALSWVLFGQTLRGLKADEVACRFTKKPCRVQLNFEMNGEILGLTRTRRPADLILYNWDTKIDSDAKGIQDIIDSKLGFGFRTFRNAVVFGQGAFERFAQAGQSDQMRMLDEIQGLDFAEAREKAKTWRDKARRRFEEIEADLYRHGDQIRTGLEKIRQLERMRNDFEQEKAKLVSAAENTLKVAESNAKREETKYTNILNGNERLGALKIELDALKRQTHEADLVETEEGQLHGYVEFAKRQKSEIINKMKSLLLLDQCPTCRQTVKSSAGKIKKAWDKEIEIYEAKYKEAVEKHAPVQKELKRLHKNLGVLEARICKKYDLESLDVVKDLEIKYGDMAVRNQNEMFRIAFERTREAKIVLSREKTREWSGDGPMRTHENSVFDAESSSKILVKERERVQDAEIMASYWYEAFGDRGLRSLMFDSLAPFLNSRLAEHLEALTAGEVEVEISALSSLKKGGVKEKLSLAAEWAWGAGSYAGGSAGQDRRIDLAMFAALQDLAERRSARPFPLRIWDEAGDSLDSRGKEIFAEWIRKEARHRGSGFVITHDREFGEIVEADNVWTVILDKDGARVEL